MSFEELWALPQQLCHYRAGNDGMVEESEFNLVFATAKQKIQGKKNDVAIKRMLVELMEEHGLNKVKTGWFSNWYGNLKKELGMA